MPSVRETIVEVGLTLEMVAVIVAWIGEAVMNAWTTPSRTEGKGEVTSTSRMACSDSNGRAVARPNVQSSRKVQHSWWNMLPWSRL